LNRAGYIDYLLKLSYLITLESYSHSFLTCYHEPLVTFEFYLDPFHVELWIAFIVSGLLLSVSLYFTINHVFGKDKYKSLSLLLFLLATVSDDSCDLPEAIQQNVAVRIMLSPWYLSTVVIVNAYIGLVISSLTGSFSLTSVGHFNELTEIKYKEHEIMTNLLWQRTIDNESFYELKAKDISNFSVTNYDLTGRYFNHKKDFKIYSSPSSGLEYYHGFFSHKSQMLPQSFGNTLMGFALTQIGPYFNVFNRWKPNFSVAARLLYEDHKKSKSKTYRKFSEVLFNLFYPSHLAHPSGFENALVRNSTSGKYKWKDKLKYSYLVEREIVKCGRSAFVDRASDVMREYNYLSRHYHRTKFFLSQESILSERRIWVFPWMDDDFKIIKYIKLLISSGILFKTKEYFDSAKYRRRHNYTLLGMNLLAANANPNGPVALTLSDRIQTCFYIFAIFISVSFACFVRENVTIHCLRLVVSSTLSFMIRIKGLMQFGKMKYALKLTAPKVNVKINK